MITFKKYIVEAQPTFLPGPFIRTHGKEPKGYGLWIFSIDPNADDPNFWFFAKPATLNKAKKEAIKHFKNARNIYIMP